MSRAEVGLAWRPHLVFAKILVQQLGCHAGKLAAGLTVAAPRRFAHAKPAAARIVVRGALHEAAALGLARAGKRFRHSGL